MDAIQSGERIHVDTLRVSTSPLLSKNVSVFHVEMKMMPAIKTRTLDIVKADARTSRPGSAKVTSLLGID